MTSVLTATTTAPSSAALKGRLPGYFGQTTGIVSLAVLLLYMPRRFRGKLNWLPVIIAGIFVAGFISACGGNTQTPPVTNPGTPTGNSNIVVSAQASVGTTVVATEELTVNLVVQ